jgi:hypothetical protein
VIPNFRFKFDLQILLRTQAYNLSNLQDLAKRIFEAYLRDKDFKIAMQVYLDVCYTIDDIKVATLGRSATTLRSNALMQATAMIFARDTTNVRGQIDQLGNIDAYIDFAKTSSGLAAWFFPKLEILRGSIRNAQSADWLGESIVMHPFFSGLANDIAFEAKHYAEEMAHELAVLRKYGVKSSYFQDGMIHAPSQAWVFIDFHELDFANAERNSLGVTSALAFIGLAEKKDLKTIGFSSINENSSIGRVQGARPSFPSIASMCIDIEGELDASFGWGLMPLRPFFARYNNEAGYELLRFAQVLRLYDLTVPEWIVSTMPQPRIPRGPLGWLQSLVSRKKKFNLDLIVPRLRTLENIDRLAHDLEREIEQAETETRARAKRESPHQNVIWHIRRLPQGKSHTVEAATRAAEYGIVLAAHETFVRPHERGKGKEEKGIHRARTRSR